MSLRFVTNLVLLLAGGFLAVATQAFSSGTTGWLALGVALGILAVTGVAQVDRARGRLQRALDGVAGALGVWTVVASVVFDGATLTWLTLAEALGFVAIAIAGLVAHEMVTERVVHALEAPGIRSQRDLEPAA
jgi:hypothetical protein